MRPTRQPGPRIAAAIVVVGLAVRDLVQGAGGSIRVGHVEGGGAAFTVVLPVRPSPTGVDDHAVGGAPAEA